MSATAFQRRRREIAAQKEAETANIDLEKQNKGDEENGPENFVNNEENEQAAKLSDSEIDEMSKDNLLAELKNRGIVKPVNTGIKKLKEALKDANS